MKIIARLLDKIARGLLNWLDNNKGLIEATGQAEDYRARIEAMKTKLENLEQL